VEASPTLASERPVSVLTDSPADGAALLYERYYDRVLGYCLYQLGSREEAEDVTQTTFMWAYRGLRRGVVPRAEASWLFTIAQNACRARHRTRGRKRDREVLSDPVVLSDMSPAHIADADELIGLEDALARMPELQRRAILLREWRGLSYKEIAAELQLSDAAVETLIFRARRTLAELLAGKPAPKRARRFAFFPAAAAAFKGVLGSGTVAKIAVGLAAAVVAATVAGSSEHVSQPSKPAVKPSVASVSPGLPTKSKSKPARPRAQAPGKETASRPVLSPKHPAPSASAPEPRAVVDDPVATLTETADGKLEKLDQAVAPVADPLAPLDVRVQLP
jgi:RNA polymerase sigma-70 factor (ECF subfamily)